MLTEEELESLGAERTTPAPPEPEPGSEPEATPRRWKRRLSLAGVAVLGLSLVGAGFGWKSTGERADRLNASLRRSRADVVAHLAQIEKLKADVSNLEGDKSLLDAKAEGLQAEKDALEDRNNTLTDRNGDLSALAAALKRCVTDTNEFIDAVVDDRQLDRPFLQRMFDDCAEAQKQVAEAQRGTTSV